MRKSKNVDMLNGPLLKNILLYAFPLMFSGILQLLFNAADMVVVGRFTGPQALAAVGSTTSLINLLVNLFIGISVGTNVLVARYVGARDEAGVTETVHTSVMVAAVTGFVLIFVGFFLSEPMLTLMGTPEDVIQQSVLYMRIYFAGMPAIMVYNFGAAILRAIGDTKRPLYFLTLSGVVNVVLNLIFVICFHMGVAGVALATIISQAISAYLVLLTLHQTEGICQLRKEQLKIHSQRLIEMLRVGLPAGVQGCVFSISNVLIQSSINSFGSLAMAGNTAGFNIEAFLVQGSSAFYQSCVSFTSQNLGAGKIKRIKKIVMTCFMCTAVTGIVVGPLATLFGEQLLLIFTDDPEVIRYGIIRMSYMCNTLCLGAVMDVMCGGMRGLGYSVAPMLASLSGACLFRIVWIYTIFQTHHTLEILYLSYPISWTLTFLVHTLCFVWAYHRLKKQNTLVLD